LGKELAVLGVGRPGGHNVLMDYEGHG
jgi:hypothetical protein